MTKFMAAIAVMILIFVALFSVSCSSAANTDNVLITQDRYATESDIVQPINYGNGVYYFDAIEAKFGNSLSYFIGQHKELEFAGATSDNTGYYGKTQGYFVVFRNK